MKAKKLLTNILLLGLIWGCWSCQKAPELTLTGPATLEISADGGSNSITFTANRDWSMRSSDSWVSVSPSSGTASDGTVTVSIRCNENTTYEDRSATITITMEELSQMVTVKQPANLGIVIPTQTYNLASDARSIEVEVQSNVQYSVSVSDNWIKQTGTKVLTSNKLTFSVEENDTYAARSATITIKPQNATVQEQVISVKQAQKNALIVKDSSFNLPYGGGGVEVKVETNVSFDVTPNVDWIHYVSTKALSNSTVSLSVDENLTYNNREGKVEIKQKNGSLSHTILVKQAGRIAISSIELNKTSLTLKEGESETLIATVKPDNATDKTVTWSSSAPSIATVDETGSVMAIAKGEATITAKAGEKTATCTVTISNNVIVVEDVTLNKTSLFLKIGEHETLVATVKPDNATDKKITWSTSDDSVATVNDSGMVTAQKVGIATITALFGDLSAACNVTVRSESTNDPEGTVDLGMSILWATKNLGASTPEDFGNSYAWGEVNTKDKYSLTNYLFLDKDFYKYYKKAQFIKYNDRDGKTKLDPIDDAATVNLGGKWRMPTEEELWGLFLSCYWEPGKTGIIGKEYYLKGTSFKTGETIIIPAITGYHVNNLWTSEGNSRTAITHELYPKSIKGDLYVESFNGLYIRPVYDPSQEDFVPISSISLDKTELTLEIGETVSLVPTIMPANATDKTVLWTCPDSKSASVDRFGKVTAWEEGTAYIEVYACGKTATCTITVVAKSIAVTNVLLDKTTLDLQEGESASLSAIVKPENATNKTVTWSSSNTSVATVDENGKVTAITAGTTTIKAQAEEQFSTCSVTVKPPVIPISSIEVDRTRFFFSEGETENLSVTIKPDNATDKSIIWESNAIDVVSVDQNGKITAVSIGEATITAKAGQMSVSCSVTVRNPPEGSVDLGLSVFWAKCNIGASKTEEFGDSYAWGETETKTSYSMSNYKWWNESSKTLTKYNTSSSNGTVDNKMILDEADDVAHVRLGGTWRMPTDAELEELKNSCTWTWINYNGVNGYLVTSDMSSKSIFLPAAGYWRDSLLSLGNSGCYWSSSINKDHPSYAWSLVFAKSGVGFNWENRMYGYSVRPVSK